MGGIAPKSEPGRAKRLAGISAIGVACRRRNMLEPLFSVPAGNPAKNPGAPRDRTMRNILIRIVIGIGIYGIDHKTVKSPY